MRVSGPVDANSKKQFVAAGYGTEKDLNPVISDFKKKILGDKEIDDALTWTTLGVAVVASIAAAIVSAGSSVAAAAVGGGFSCKSVASTYYTFHNLADFDVIDIELPHQMRQVRTTTEITRTGLCLVLLGRA
ncbi:MAG: hypothetical protein LBP35_06890 [Candidatus Ancillula trichonymphae]|jgi:hypothetical protein|nr:hypothetical protein [Candidatus Ancillula trichonymphae]